MKLDTLTPGGHPSGNSRGRSEVSTMSETIRTIRETDLDGAVAANAAGGWE